MYKHGNGSPTNHEHCYYYVHYTADKAELLIGRMYVTHYIAIGIVKACQISEDLISDTLKWETLSIYSYHCLDMTNHNHNT